MEASYGIAALSTTGYCIEVYSEVKVKLFCALANATLSNPAERYLGTESARMARTQNDGHVIKHHEIQPLR